MMNLIICFLLFLQAKSLEEYNNQKNISDLVFAKINQERIKKGLDGLEWNTKLESSSRLHATQMATLNFFSHYHPKDKTINSPSDRMKKFGYNFKMNGENNASQSYSLNILPSDEEIASKFVYIWMNSAIHHKIIFTKEFKEAAITIVSIPRPGGIIKYYAVMNFGVQ